MRSIVRVIVALLAVGLCAGAARAVTVSELNCSITPPPGMDPMPKSEVDDLTRRVGKSNVTYVYGFRQRGAITPYVLIQKLPRPGGDPRRHLAEFKSSLPGGDVTWDEGRKAFVAYLRINNLRAKSYAFVGADYLAMVHCYDQSEDFPNTVKTFDAMADTFAFAPGYRFEDYSPFRFGMIVYIALGLAVAGGVVAVIVLRAQKKGMATGNTNIYNQNV